MPIFINLRYKIKILVGFGFFEDRIKSNLAQSNICK